jgi:20S proteasome alpha/beta subunit
VGKKKRTMTITVSILVPSGIVLAADSRQVTETASGRLRVDSDKAEKIIQLGPRMAAMVNGQGSFYANREESPLSIGNILSSSASHLPKNIAVRDATVYLHRNLTTFLKKHISSTDSKQFGSSFFLAGYNPGKNIGELYRCDIPGKIILERRTNDAGAVWNGERAIINRLIMGYDPRLIESLANVVNIEHRDKCGQVLQGLQLHINFQTMPLQDAVDFAVLLVRTTIELMYFADGMVSSPAQFPTCGGDIEVAAITEAEGFCWLRHKILGVQYP